jgi:hypothetical protein
MFLFRRFPLCGVVLSLALLAAGCGRPGPSLSGRVSYRGVPLTTGGVMLHAADGRTAYGGISPDGSYLVANAPEGPVRISVNVPVVDRPRRPSKTSAGSPSDLPLPQVKLLGGPEVVAIPARYGRPDSSGLNVVIGPGGQRYDIDLR